MRAILCVALVLLSLGVLLTEGKPRPNAAPSTQDLQLRSLLRALEDYVNIKKKAHSSPQQRSNGDDSLEQGDLSPSDEDDAESQTVLIGNNEVKPKNLHPNKKQEKDDSKDKSVPPPVVGINKNVQTRNFGISKSLLWANGIIPYEVVADSFGSRYSKALDLVRNTAVNISRNTCVKWRQKTSADKHYVKIIGNDNGCYSYVGNIQRDGGQELNLGEGCLDEYVTLHEMHHAMGGLHEQQRNRRKYFVKINWDNIDQNNNDQYALNAHTKNNEVYDYASILQYHLTAFTSNGKDTMTIPDRDLEYLISESKYDLSFYDMAEVNKEYDCPSSSCTLSCQNEGFRMQGVDQTTCHCHCPSGLKGTTCEELDTDSGCGKIISLSNGGSEEIKITSYSVGRSCTWLVKGKSNSLIKATVTSIDLPFSSQDDCYHWLEFRYYLIGDKGKEVCGKSTTPKTFTQTFTGEASPFLIRFNSQKSHTPGTGFTVKVEAVKSGCMSSPCKTGSLCTEGSGDGSYTCSCQNGLSGKHCDEFRAPSYNLCNLEQDYGTCLFDQDPTSAILWSFNTRLCSFGGCDKGVITRGSGYQFLTMTPYYDGVQFDVGYKAVLKTTAKFTAADRCLSFLFALGNFQLNGGAKTELNVYVEGTGKAKTKVKNLQSTTSFEWKTESVSIEAVDNLVISIEGVFGPQQLGVDNISLRPGLCTNTPCIPNPCKNGGSCDESSPPSGSKYVCTCPSGFTGDRCESSQTTSPCGSNTCQNGATCVADATKSDGYRCDCAVGFTGDKCEKTVTTDSCNGNTCQNGATCVADATKTDGYRCDCTTGFTGDKCEQTVTTDSCNGNTCQNGASCDPDATKTDGYRCDCATGFTGDKCETAVNPCNGNTCQNGASCVADATKTDGYRCDCATGFTGDKCEKTDYCANSPCNNGGTCTSGATTFTCQCTSGYTGTGCDTSVTTVTPDNCDPTPCKNGATCFSFDFGFYCLCTSSYTGEKCETETGTTDPCDGNTCQNGASCVADATKADGYRCDCATGFTGDKCEKTDYCASSPCNNGGTCTSGATTFTCQCTSGYTGTGCDTSVTSDYCDPSPCKNGGSCYSFDFGFYCSCTASYTGEKCETETYSNLCTFETDEACFLDFSNTAWHRNTHQTPGGIAAEGGSHYLFLDTRSYKANYFYDDMLEFEDKTYCLTFAFYMSGDDVGELYVYTYKYYYEEHFKMRGPQGDQWHRASVNLPLDPYSYIVIEGTAHSGSKMALDDVKLSPNPCL